MSVHAFVGAALLDLMDDQLRFKGPWQDVCSHRSWVVILAFYLQKGFRIENLPAAPLYLQFLNVL